MYSLEQGEQADLQEILDFANMVFGMEYGNINFEKLMSKAYNRKRANMIKHHVIRKEGKIKALIDSYPINIRMNDSNYDELCLKGEYIGTVCVHPKSRGKGYMIKLMQEAEKNAIEMGTDIMLLYGNRHRYQHYGFDCAGMRYNFSIDYRNAKHASRNLMQLADNNIESDECYCFEKADDECEFWDDMYEMYSKRTVTARDYEDFKYCLKTNGAEPYVILLEDEFIGYFVLSKEGKNIIEFEVDEIEVLPHIIYDMMSEFGMDSIGVSVGTDEIEKIQELNNIADYYNLCTLNLVKILNYEKVFKFLLEWKKTYSELEDGEICFCIISEDRKKKYINILIKDGNIDVSCNASDSYSECIKIKERELVALLTTTMCYTEMHSIDGKLVKVPKSWLPLPFFLSECDAF